MSDCESSRDPLNTNNLLRCFIHFDLFKFHEIIENVQCNNEEIQFDNEDEMFNVVLNDYVCSEAGNFTS